MIARVFPTRTNATPTDKHAYFGPPGLFESTKGYTGIHVSVLFTWLKSKAEWLADEWLRIAPVKIGGPGVMMRGEEFEPGMYVKSGYTITSRGCPNKCWFCSVWKRDGNIRELPIKDGWNVLDDNLLACSEDHIQAVFKMLENHRGKVELTGGLEAKRLQPWHVELLVKVKVRQMFFAYDEEADLEPLVVASKMLRDAGFTRSAFRCYVLIGYPTDTMESAEKRLMKTVELGAFPMAMLWKNERGEENKEWRRFQRGWARPACIARKLKSAPRVGG